ncbi:unnamed protein product [Choristocarpus tenellus]
MIGYAKTSVVLFGVVTFLCSFAPVVAQDCSGIVDSGNDICCPSECGVCGGTGCGNLTMNGPSDCCKSDILASNLFCSDTQGPPCILPGVVIDVNGTCAGTDEVAGIRDPVEDVCCPLECGVCGGSGCGVIPGTTAEMCCSENIMASSQLCSVTGVAPCVIDSAEASNTTCSNGLEGIEDPILDVCCASNCGQCGGEGCGSIVGTGGASDCCSNTIASSGSSCNDTRAAPCIITYDVVTSTCPNGFAGVAEDNVCCAEACNGQCGGAGCGTIPGTNGASDCCVDAILQTNLYCNVGIVAPCIMIDGTYTDAPTASPSLAPTMMGTVLGTMVPTTMSPGTTLAPGTTAAPTAGEGLGSGETPSPSSSDQTREIDAGSSLGVGILATVVAGGMATLVALN